MDQQWIQDLFLDLVQIDSPSLREGKVAQRLTAELQALGFTVHSDEAGKLLGGETGNLIALLDGDKSRQTVMLAAHMDTVQPGEGVKPRLDAEGVVWSDGQTVLGADDKAGVTAVLAAVRELVTSNRPHGPIQVVFTIGEEIGLQGVKNLNPSTLRASVGLSLDSGGEIGTVVVAGPAQVRWEATVHGKAAHAGVAPEKGISAIRVAALAVAKMPHGRIDAETTVNIGSFVGEGPNNVVRDHVRLVGEARSRSSHKLQQALHDIEQAFLFAASATGAKAVFSWETMYDGFRFEADAPVRQMIESALQSEGFPPRPVESGGGSDANVFTAHGVPTINIGIGYEDIHSTNEHIRLSDIEKAARIAVAFCEFA